MKIVFFNASDSSGVELAFRKIVQQRMDALFVSADGFLLTRSEQIVTLASWIAIPATYGWRQAVTRGGLMSYGTNFHASWRQAGIYTGRILKGENPIALPVQQVTKVELLLNLKTAKTLGLFAGSQGGTVAPAGGNTCAPRPVRLDLVFDRPARLE